MAHAMTIIRQAASNEYLWRALQNAGNYQDILDLQTEAQTRLDKLTNTQQPDYPQHPGQIDKWLKAAYTTAEQQRSTETQRDVLRGLVNNCTLQIDTLLATHADDMLSSLHTDLTTVMAEVTDIASQLDGATTAAEAVDHGTAEAWRKLKRLHTPCEQIRSAQMMITPLINLFAIQDATSPHLPDPLASDLILSNLDDLVPGWRQQDTRVNLGGPLEPRQPWPTDPDEQLLWVATSSAQPWVPTSGQLARLNYHRNHDGPPPDEVNTLNPWTGESALAPLRIARAIKTIDA